MLSEITPTPQASGALSPQKAVALGKLKVPGNLLLILLLYFILILLL